MVDLEPVSTAQARTAWHVGVAPLLDAFPTHAGAIIRAIAFAHRDPFPVPIFITGRDGAEQLADVLLLHRPHVGGGVDAAFWSAASSAFAVGGWLEAGCEQAAINTIVAVKGARTRGRERIMDKGSFCSEPVQWPIAPGVPRDAPGQSRSTTTR